MIELFIFLFIIQGHTPDDWLQSCKTDFIGIEEKISERNSDILFCKYVNELNLSVDDIKKLGKEFDWSNYAIETSKDFLNDWDFYQKNGDKETLVIWPSISTRDSLPPAMKVTISFNSTENKIQKYHEEEFSINPLCDPPISQDGICNQKVILDISSRSESEIYCPSTHIAIDGKCQPVNYINPLYWILLIALIPVILIIIFVLKSKRKTTKS